MSSLEMIQPTDVIVADRFRHDLGDLDALARDIEATGLLQPIVITPDHQLIAGMRRLNAWQRTSHKDAPIPAHVVDVKSLTRGEFSENMLRKDFTISERLAIMDSLSAQMRAARAAPDRPMPGRRGRPADGAILDIVGDHLGVSRSTLNKAAAVANAARRNPGKYQFLVDRMDRTGKVDAAFRELRSLGGFTPKKGGRRRAARDIFDELLQLPRSIAYQRLIEFEQAVVFLRHLINAAGVGVSELDEIGALVRPDQIEAAKRAARAAAVGGGS